MRKVTAGIIGTGFIGLAHIEALKRLGFVDIVAIADKDIESAMEKAKQMSIPKAYGDYREVIKDKEIETVHICTPNNTHYQIAKEALNAGKNVICEKPMALNYKEAYELAQIAKKKKLINAVGFNLRFYPLIQHVKELVKGGSIGKVLSINGSYRQDWLFYKTDYNWRLQPKYSGESRAVADIGSHWLDMVEYITGEKVEKVCADFATFHQTREKPAEALETYSSESVTESVYNEKIKIYNEDYAAVLLKFSNKIHGSMIVSQVSAGRKNDLFFEICGDKKAISWNSERPNELWIGRRDSDNGLLIKDPLLMHNHSKKYAGFPGGHTEGFPDAMKNMFSEIYNFIGKNHKAEEEPPTFATFEDGAWDMNIIEAILKSSKEERWIDVKKN